MKAIILAAGRGSRMGTLTDEKPKCLLEVYGKPLIEHQIEALTKAGIKEVALVTGYKSKLLNHYGDFHFHNPKWAETNMVYSLLCAKEWLETSDCIVSYADIYYQSQIVRDLIDCHDDIAIAYDPNWLDLWSKRFENPLDDAETFKIDLNNYLLEIGQTPKTVEEIQGQYMGLFKLKKKFFMNQLVGIARIINHCSMTLLLSNFLKHKINIKGVSNMNLWFEIDQMTDLELICSAK